jgi:hypothetical protein
MDLQYVGIVMEDIPREAMRMIVYTSEGWSTSVRSA